MFLLSRNLFLILLILFILISPIIILNFGLVDVDDMLDDDGFFMIGNLTVVWTNILIRQASASLGLGVFIFALHVTYLGGRLKNKRFNDRTIHLISSLTLVHFEALLNRGASIFYL